MTPKQRILDLINAIVPDIRVLLSGLGDPAALTGTATNVVDDLNALRAELDALGSNGSAVIDDAAGDGVTTATWSANKIHDTILEARNAVRDEILGGAGAAVDTLKELGDLSQTQGDSLAALLTAVANTVRFTAQPVPLTAAQQAQARTNIAGASQADLSALRGEFDVTEAQVAELDYDFAAEYVALRDA